MKQERIKREKNTIYSFILFFEANEHTQSAEEKNRDQKDEGVWSQHKERVEKICKTNVILLDDIESD